MRFEREVSAARAALVVEGFMMRGQLAVRKLSARGESLEIEMLEVEARLLRRGGGVS